MKSFPRWSKATNSHINKERKGDRGRRMDTSIPDTGYSNFVSEDQKMAVVLFVSIRNSGAQVGVLETIRLRTLKVLKYSLPTTGETMTQ